MKLSSILYLSSNLAIITSFLIQNTIQRLGLIIISMIWLIGFTMLFHLEKVKELRKKNETLKNKVSFMQ